MKRTALYLILIIVSCNTNKESGTSADPALLSSGCYRMVIDKDSAMMNLSVNGNIVSGKLEYKRFEKDRNTGNFTGEIDSSKIRGWYTFQSEGMVSIREVVFKINGDKLSEGYGDIELKGDTAYFKYPHALNYEENHPFIKVNCK